jgi:hypothetical protein
VSYSSFSEKVKQMESQLSNQSSANFPQEITLTVLFKLKHESPTLNQQNIHQGSQNKTPD